MKKVFILLTLICFSIKIDAQTKVFGHYTHYSNSGDGIGIINNNKIQFYEYDNSKWKYLQEMDMRLPNGYSYVLNLMEEDLIGITIGNQFRAYTYGYYNNDSWQYYPYIDMELPNRYKYILGLCDIIGVVIDYRINFYNVDGDYISEMDMILPNGYTNVFILDEDIIGIVIGNKIRFYELDDSWEYLPELDMSIPYGHGDIFSIYNYIGVVFDEKIQFYDRNNSWKYIPEMDFFFH